MSTSRLRKDLSASPLNVAGYVRLSVATEESVSVASQVRLIQAECARRGWPPPTLFTDEGVSGSKTVVRPGRDDLERRLALGEFDAVLVKSVDRLARSVLDFFRIADTAAKAGASLIVIEAGLDTSTPIGKMIVGILAQFAEFEAATIGQRVTLSNAHRRKEGRALGGPVPYGLRNVTRDDRPGMYRETDPEEAVVVLRMVDELLAGHSLRAIAKGLQDDGIPTPRARDAALAGREPEEVPWGYTAVRRILQNPAIAGMERHLGEVARGEDGLRRVNEALAIIDADTYRRVQAALKERGEHAQRRTPHAERLLLEGLARCAHCGGPMRRAATRGYVSYHCANAGRAAGVCPSPATIAAPRLEDFVVAEFLDALGAVPRTRLERTTDATGSGDLAEVRAEITDTAASFATAAPGDIATLADRMTTLRETEARLLAAQDAAPIYAVTNTGQTWAEAWAAVNRDGYTNADRRTLLAEAIERVMVARPTMRGAVPPVAERVVIAWE